MTERKMTLEDLADIQHKIMNEIDVTQTLDITKNLTREQRKEIEEAMNLAGSIQPWEPSEEEKKQWEEKDKFLRNIDKLKLQITEKLLENLNSFMSSNLTLAESETVSNILENVRRQW